MEKITFRCAQTGDAGRLADIYAPYVRDTAVTFECEPPDAGEFAGRIRDICQRYPFLAAVSGGVAAGYAYASSFHARAAYRWDAELSVYVDPRYHRRGIAAGLYSRLLQLLAMQGYLNAYALITLPNEGSMRLHEKFGFQNAGVWHGCGYKLGQWRDVICLEKRLCPLPSFPREPLAFDKLSQKQLDAVLSGRFSL